MQASRDGGWKVAPASQECPVMPCAASVALQLITTSTPGCTCELYRLTCDQRLHQGELKQLQWKGMGR